MRKLIPQIETVTCDITGKRIDNQYPNYHQCSIFFSLIFLDEKKKKDLIQYWEDDEAEMSKKEIEAEACELREFSMDFSEEVAIEIYKFLKRKYPEQMKKFEKVNKLGKVVKSDS